MFVNGRKFVHYSMYVSINVWNKFCPHVYLEAGITENEFYSLSNNDICQIFKNNQSCLIDFLCKYNFEKGQLLKVYPACDSESVVVMECDEKTVNESLNDSSIITTFNNTNESIDSDNSYINNTQNHPIPIQNILENSLPSTSSISSQDQSTG